MIDRFNTFQTVSQTVSNLLGQQRSAPRRARQLTALAALLGMAACSSAPPMPKGAIGFVEGFLGGVVADEPRAALIGRDILSSGGSAADAATAMYFALSVTLPSRAGLGGGGMCVAFDRASGKTEALDFTSPIAKSVSSGATHPSAVPTNPRGFFALQARYGKLLWGQLLQPAENLARFGHPVSRAFAHDLQLAGAGILADPGARAMFTAKATGQLAGETQSIEQLDLAATLGLLRAKGVGPLYTGRFAKTFVQGVNSVGGSLSAADLRGFTPTWRNTVRLDIGFDVAHFAPPPAAASTQAAVMWAMLREEGRYDDVDAGGRAHLLAETAVHAFADRETWLDAAGRGTKDGNALVLPQRIETLVRGVSFERKTDAGTFVPRPQNRRENAAATTFAAADAEGNAVVCAVSMNASFGTGRVAPGTGVLLAAAPDTAGRGATGLAPMLMVNENTKEFILAAGANGGVAAPTALTTVVAGLVDLDQSAKEALAAPRVHNGGEPDVTYHEQGFASPELGRLSTAGHRLSPATKIGVVNVLYCPNGLPTTPETCQMAVDPRGFGLASGSMR